MRNLLLLSFLLLLGAATGAAQRQHHEHQHPYRQHWKHATYGKKAVAGVTGKAAIGDVTSHTGSDVEDLGKGIGTGFAGHAVKTTVEHAVAAPLHEDLHYHRSTKRGVGPRLKHALVSTVVTHNTRTGKRTPAAGKVSGNAAAGVVSATVLPVAGGAATAGAGLAADAGANVAREFWPRKKRHSAAKAAHTKPRE